MFAVSPLSRLLANPAVQRNIEFLVRRRRKKKKYKSVRIKNLVREVFDRLFVDRQNDVSLPQMATLKCWLAREQTFDADHTATVWPRVKLRNVKAKAEARQTLLQDHLVRVF